MNSRGIKRLPFTRKPLGLRDVGGGHFGGDKVAGLDGSAAAVPVRKLRCRKVQPQMGSDIVLWHSLPVEVHDAEVMLCLSEPSISCNLIPLGGGAVVLRNAQPYVIHISELILRLGDPFFG